MQARLEWIVRNWLWLLCAGLGLRLALAPNFYGFGYDMDTFGQWAEALVAYPWSEFYAVAPAPDHLPGDLYLHALLGEAFLAGGGENFLGDAYRLLLKIVPAFADIAIALVMWLAVRRVAGERFGRLTALAYAWNPGAIFLSAVWGQWDAVSGLILLLAFVVVWRWPARWVAAVPLMAWAVLIKPPLALLCLLGLLFVPLRDLWRGAPLAAVARGLALPVGSALVAGVGTIIVLLAPFDTGVPGMEMRWTLQERVETAVEMYPHTTLGAANIWMIPLGSPDRVSDRDPLIAGLSAQQVGTFLLAAALLWVGWTIVRRWREMTPMTLTVWAMATANYAYFLLPTRAHERYLYPAVMLLVVLWGIEKGRRRLTRLVAGISLAYVLNLLGVYAPVGGAFEVAWFVAVSVANVALFLLLATYPGWRDAVTGDAEPVMTPLPVYADDFEVEVGVRAV
jgi:hypothetical protein